MLERFGVATYERLGPRLGSADAMRHRNAVAGAPTRATDVLRIRAYAALRARLDEERGVPPYSTCRDVRRVDDSAQVFRATIATRTREHQLTLGVENGLLRVLEIQ